MRLRRIAPRRIAPRIARALSVASTVWMFALRTSVYCARVSLAKTLHSGRFNSLNNSVRCICSSTDLSLYTIARSSRWCTNKLLLIPGWRKSWPTAARMHATACSDERLAALRTPCSSIR